MFKLSKKHLILYKAQIDLEERRQKGEDVPFNFAFNSSESILAKMKENYSGSVFHFSCFTQKAHSSGKTTTTTTTSYELTTTPSSKKHHHLHHHHHHHHQHHHESLLYNSKKQQESPQEQCHSLKRGRKNTKSSRASTFTTQLSEIALSCDENSTKRRRIGRRNSNRNVVTDEDDEEEEGDNDRKVSIVVKPSNAGIDNNDKKKKEEDDDDDEEEENDEEESGGDISPSSECTLSNPTFGLYIETSQYEIMTKSDSHPVARKARKTQKNSKVSPLPKVNSGRKKQKQADSIHGEQSECCLIGCHNAVTNRLRFSLRCHKAEDFKDTFLTIGWNKVCHYHYFSDLYRYKKMTHSLSTGKQTSGKRNQCGNKGATLQSKRKNQNQNSWSDDADYHPGTKIHTM